MTHLTPDELLDVIEQSPVADRYREHLDSCEQCRTEAAALSAVLGTTRRVDIPEPSPLFWDQFSRRVHEAIAVEPGHVSNAARCQPLQGDIVPHIMRCQLAPNVIRPQIVRCQLSRSGDGTTDSPANLQVRDENLRHKWHNNKVRRPLQTQPYTTMRSCG